MAEWTMQRMMPTQIQMLGRDETDMELIARRGHGYLTLRRLEPRPPQRDDRQKAQPAVAGRPIYIFRNL